MKWKATNAQITDKGAVRINARDALRSDEARVQLAAVRGLREQSPAFAYQHAGAILSVPEDMQPRDLILALRVLERQAIEDYLRRTADCGGT